MIHARQLCKSFKDRVVLNGIDLQIRAQEAVAIIGPSGSGKSVLLKLLAGLYPPTQGELTVESQQISMLFQKNALFDSVTNLENLLIPLSETIGVTGDTAEKQARDMLEAVGLAHAASLFPDEISGGMQKRLGIARALIIQPEVILYDEPTAGLDPITSHAIAELMMDLHKKNRTTLVMVTNDLQRAYQIADRIYFCENGKLMDAGTPDELKKTKNPRLQQFIFSSAIPSVGASL